MSHIFISYSHLDTKYVEKLEKKLIHEGFRVWIDHRIDYGSQWTQEIETAIDTCDAYIVVMSENAKKSKWVQREVIHAERRKKPFFPLLLDGEFWFSMGNIQYVDVSNGSLPPDDFFTRLGATLEPSLEPQRPKASPTQRINSGSIVRILGVLIFVVVGFFVLLKVLKGIDQFMDPDSELPIELTVTQTLNIVQPTAVVIDTQTITVTPILTPTLTPIPEQITDDKGIPMVLIPSGEFAMGSSVEVSLANCENFHTNQCKEFWYIDEQPVHEVYVDHYYIDVFEVSNSSYMDCVQDGFCLPPANDIYTDEKLGGFPVVNVDWYGAVAYCEWREARLPTEAEWEKAARGTEMRSYPWGEGLDCSRANFMDCDNEIKPVEIYPRGQSQYGVYQMAGNVSEWVGDWYLENYYADSPNINPQGPSSGKIKVIRGGSWKGFGDYLRVTYRYWNAPLNSSGDLGFRCARSATP